jgi:hypothetical protein
MCAVLTPIVGPGGEIGRPVTSRMPSLCGPAEACFEGWKSAWAGGGWSGSSWHCLAGPNRPARAFGAGSEPRYFDYLRAINGDAQSVKRVRRGFLDEYRKAEEAALRAQRHAVPEPSRTACPASGSRSFASPA